MSHRVLAIIVSYNPTPETLLLSLKATSEQVDSVLIVDNASKNIDELFQCVDDYQSTSKLEINIIRQPENIGLGAAHNIGIAKAKKSGFSHVLLMDQDSVPLPNMVINLLSAEHKKLKQKVSAFGVNYLNADNGSESFFIQFGKLKFRRFTCKQQDSDGCVKADFLISSGTLISLEILEAVGGMDEGLFIDHVDTEWFLRAKSKGYTAYGVCDAVMQHGLGETTHRVSPFGLNNIGRERNVPQHKPFRYYYIFRNSLVLYRRDYPSVLWKWNDFQRLVLIALMFGLFKAPRLQNSKMMLNGVIDGFRGVTGKADFH